MERLLGEGGGGVRRRRVLGCCWGGGRGVESMGEWVMRLRKRGCWACTREMGAGHGKVEGRKGGDGIHLRGDLGAHENGYRGLLFSALLITMKNDNMRS